ncbi:MAPEG family protein [Yoonia sp. SS1-5]|uniref:MAPEG family protein n=1 Tax=Yoonia rhodophyticola TaxID=3137370 RepID=A0AAN0MDH2_9RHOB
MTLTISPVYAAILVAWFLVLSVRVITYRRANRIAYGDDGNKWFIARIRAQANFAEYAPVGIILLALIDLQGVPAIWLHLCGVTLTLGRLLHGLGLSFLPRQLNLRVAGMALTLVALALGAAINLIAAIF